MKLQEEIKEIFTHLRHVMVANHDIGFETPHIIAKATPLPYTARKRFDTNTFAAPPITTIAGSLEHLEATLKDCTKCKLHKGRTHLVFGEGSPRARLVFVGEGPGEQEDLTGRPFVGKAGELLTKIIENGIGITRNAVYICNIVKCRPPNNRDPEKEEIDTCLPFLNRQLRLIKPDVICALGRVAGQAMLGDGFKISKERGKWFSYMDIPLMPTYHPAYLLRYTSAKRQVWDDIKQIMKRLDSGGKRNG